MKCNNHMKRVLAVLLAVVLTLTLSAASLADDEETMIIQEEESTEDLIPAADPTVSEDPAPAEDGVIPDGLIEEAVDSGSEELPALPAETEAEAENRVETESDVPLEELEEDVQYASSGLPLDDLLTLSEGGTFLPGNKIGLSKENGLIISFDVTEAINKNLLPGITHTDADALDGNSVQWNLGSGYWPMNKDSSITDRVVFTTVNYKDNIKNCILNNTQFQLRVSKDGKKTDSSVFHFVYGGKCGTNAYWEFDSTSKTLKITGTGEISNFINKDNTPWSAFRSQIKKVDVAEGITTLGNNSFYLCESLESAVIPDSVGLIGISCFAFCYKLSEFSVSEDNNISEIQTGAFNSCTSLKTLSFPKAKKIDYWAFRNCTKPLSVYLLSDQLEPFGEINTSSYDHEGPFAWSAKLTLYVPAGTNGSAYYRSAAWSKASMKDVGIQIEISSVSVSGIEDKTYTGFPVEQKPVVKDNDYTLKEGTDYTITYENNNSIGSASLVIKGKGDYYGATKAYPFIIKSARYLNEPIESVEKRIIGVTSDADIQGSAYYILQAKAKKVKKKRVTVQWKSNDNADGYIIYGARCKQPFEKVAEFESKSASSFVHKGLKKAKYYKYVVVAYQKVGSGKNVLTISKTVHAATSGGKYANPKKVSVGNKKVTVKVGKKKKVSASVTNASGKVKRHRKLAWESSDESIAVVGKKGRITGVSKGTCYVYAYAQNGIMARVKVTVK